MAAAMRIESVVKTNFNKILHFFGHEVRWINDPKPSFLTRADMGEISLLLYFKRLMDQVNSIDGDIVECGVGKGRTFLYLSVLTVLDAKDRQIWGFDSFEGFPQPTEEDASSRNAQKGELKNITIKEEDIPIMLQEAGFPANFFEKRVHIIKGFFEESMSRFTGEHIAFLHLDVDLYQSYKQTLEYFWPKIPVGGVVLFDEYKQSGVEERFPGAAKAIDQFLGLRKRLIQYDPNANRYYMVKKN